MRSWLIQLAVEALQIAVQLRHFGDHIGLALIQPGFNESCLAE